jgi:exodeoxyribonuclease VII small subunit
MSADIPVDELSYEQARDELASVVAKLEAGTTSLEQSLALWERGEQLVAVCERWLDNAKERIEAVRQTRPASAPDTA